VNIQRTALAYFDAVLRGYGQLFLCNNPVSGVLFLLGLVLVSPENAAWSFMGASLATLGAFLFGMKAEASSGLFGVNGALLGYSWIYFPEVDASTKALFTLIGCSATIAILIPSLRWMNHLKSGITLFGIPSLIAVGLNAALLIALGFIDLNMHRGWEALARGEPAEAKQFFETVRIDNPRVHSQRADGLGWAEYRLRDYTIAREHFLWSDLGDGCCGAGWCSFQLGEYNRAEGEFRAALERDWSTADAWDGLGWTYSATGQTELAKVCFRKASLLSPLRSEANVSPRWRYVSTFQWSSWLLAFAGIAYHSRRSFLIAIIAVAWCARFGWLSDPALLYNLVPLVLALGGHYLVSNRLGLLWTSAMVVAMALAWPAATSYFSLLGLPILCLPFHLLFVPSLLLFQYLQRKGIANIAVPLGLAVTTPEQVALWFQKAEIARGCWNQLEKGANQPQEQSQ